MPLYDTEYTHALIMAMVCSLAAFLLCWLWKDLTATIKAPAIVLTQDAYITIKGKKCHLPSGLVLYPLNEGESCPEVYDEREYKIYIEIGSFKFRELTESEMRGGTNLIYRLERDL